jgi:hypothetical protein
MKSKFQYFIGLGLWTLSFFVYIIFREYCGYTYGGQTSWQLDLTGSAIVSVMMISPFIAMKKPKGAMIWGGAGFAVTLLWISIEIGISGFFSIGFGNLVLSAFFILMANILLIFIDLKVGSRKSLNGVIHYNPKEWPKLIFLLLCSIVSLYVFTMISASNIKKFELYITLFYLFLIGGLPVLLALYKLFRDRNDNVQIEGSILRYYDNKESGEIDLSQIIRIVDDKNLKLYDSKEKQYLLNLGFMNFRSTDQMSLIKDIKSINSKIEVLQSREERKGK